MFRISTRGTELKRSKTTMTDLQTILQISSARHKHLCPRQVLGARIGLAGARALGLELPRNDKRLLIILETDGCFADGVEVATGCTIGHRTLRVEDYGKTAATFVDVKIGRAVRVAPHLEVRGRAYAYAPKEPRHYFAQLHAYQVMPDAELLSIVEVQLTTPIETIVSRAGVRVNCDRCGEEIINEREVTCAGQILCRACAGDGYYQVVDAEPACVPIQYSVVLPSFRQGALLTPSSGPNYINGQVPA
jgi:formylmethanofuran dehydrogenase subunit E